MSLRLTGLFLTVSALAPAPAAASDFDQAKLAYDRTRYDDALKILNQMKESSGAVLALKGKAYFGKNDFKRAADLFEQATQRDPNSSDHYLWLGRAYGRRAETSSVFTAPGYASKARQALERSVQLNPKNGDALNDLFEYYLQEPGFLGGGMDKAAALIEKIAALDPAERHYAQFRLSEEKKEWQMAESHLRRAADLAPQQVGRHVDLGKFLARRGKIPESEVAFAKAEKIDPNSPKVWIERAETYINAGKNLPEARKLLERYLAAGNLTPEDRPKEDARKLLAKIS
jgi:tetratricopeptide (TPR) repeat protein